jgi:ppGpp synthetase/RelA/SpoT-type nucleotidyltranferase
MSIPLEWFHGQVSRYAAERPRYEALADVLGRVLEWGAGEIAPHALVQARAKSVPSFAEKILRKRPKYVDPVRQLNDLCGARVITHTREEVDAFCAFVRRHFEVDEANSEDKRAALRANEFGYRAVHYGVRLPPQAIGAAIGPVAIPPEVEGLKAEVQVRTIAQHCWAEIGHDRIYKSTFPVPDRLIRESARIAALLENVDDSFTSVVRGLEAYRASVGVYLTDEQRREEIEILRTVLEYEREPKQRQLLAGRIARLAVGLEDWDAAIEAAEALGAPGGVALLHGLGLALCRKHGGRREGPEYGRGREHLGRAAQAAPRDVEILTALAETWAGIDDERARELYERAYQIDPVHPEALGGYARMTISAARDLEVIPLIRPSLEAAIRRSEDQAEVGVNLPGAHYHAGEFHLLLRRPYDALDCYAKAIELTTREATLADALGRVDRYRRLKDLSPAIDWIRRLFLLARAARFSAGAAPPELASLASRLKRPLGGPVVIVAGGCDLAYQARMEEYRALLFEAFRDFRGTIISGGTTAGISGLVGDLAARYPGIYPIGYLPRTIPHWTTRDPRYNERGEIVVTDGADFSPAEPLQNWIDLLAAGVSPSEVKLLGINGGRIAAFEYRLALALGARVGLLRESGREAGRLLKDARKGAPRNLAVLPEDTATIKCFVEGPYPACFDADVREEMARHFHRKYRDDQKGRLARVDPSLADWPDAPEHLKESNRQLVDHIYEKLRDVGKATRPALASGVVLTEFTPEEVEHLAELEHGRWNVERLLAGWTLGPRDVVKKQSPFLVSWAELPEDVREYDRQAVREIPNVLARHGLEIVPEAPGRSH